MKRPAPSPSPVPVLAAWSVESAAAPCRRPPARSPLAAGAAGRVRQERLQLPAARSQVETARCASIGCWGATLFAVSQEERKVTLELRSVAPRAFCLWRQRAQASPSFFLSSAFSFRSRSARSFFRRAFSSSSFTRSLSSSLCVVCPAALFQ